MKNPRGMTLIEVIVATAIMLGIFLGFFEAYKVAAEVSFGAEAKTAATALMSDRMEYERSLSYSAVAIGTTSEQKNNGGVSYTLRTVVAYSDSAHDYKSVKVEVDWTFNGSPQSVNATTYLAPNS